MKKIVVIGYLGTTLDAGLGRARWDRWRPTVSLAQHEDLAVARLELFCPPKAQALSESVQRDVVQLSPNTDVRLTTMDQKNPWDFSEVYARLYDWAKGYEFDTEREEYWVHITTGTHVAQICLFLLVQSRLIPGVLLQTAPPRKANGAATMRSADMKQAGSYECIDLDLSRYDALATRMAAAHEDAVSFLKSGIATRNASFNALIEEIERVAVRSTAPVLLTGPTGAGKSMLAQRMYELKKSRHQVGGNFVDVNCATLRGDTAASALFGHKKGSFTGAGADRAGLLRSADGGVLFLDEIGELGLDEQAMLLKAIEDKRFLPVGSDVEVSSNFQLIAGTNKDLRCEVAAGRFREDLFARINLWSYVLPGLAERREDIEPNVDHFMALSAAEINRQVRLTGQARALYLKFAQSDEAIWSGNFRDLSASVTRIATLAEPPRVSVGLVEAEIERLRWLWQAPTPTTHNDVAVDLQVFMGERAASLDVFDQLQLQAVITVCRSSKSLAHAGRSLFDKSRSVRSVVNDSDRLRKYLLKHGLRFEDIQ
jgi:transcriptional regulatory protein RtcR